MDINAIGAKTGAIGSIRTLAGAADANAIRDTMAIDAMGGKTRVTNTIGAGASDANVIHGATDIDAVGAPDATSDIFGCYVIDPCCTLDHSIV